MSDLPKYSVRENPRAKHFLMKVSVKEGLIVVVPRGFDHARIPGILRRNKYWLERAQARVSQQRKFFEPEPPGKLPERINLQAIGEEWVVDYRPTDSRRATVMERRGRRLLIYGDTDNVTVCKQVLRRWLSRKAHEHLAPWLRQLADENGFQLGRVLVKSQRTRWASCSHRRTISINQKCLFLPSDLVRYVFIHELCHTIFLNHSGQFWALLHKHDSNFNQADSALRTAWKLVPDWADSRQ